jgi:hypothetical protein
MQNNILTLVVLIRITNSKCFNTWPNQERTPDEIFYKLSNYESPTQVYLIVLLRRLGI